MSFNQSRVKEIMKLGKLFRSGSFLIAGAIIATTGVEALAQKKYDPGATDKEIKIGNVSAYSGPASAYGILGKTYQAYFDKINDEGGINGRKISFISYDDAYSPPKAVEQTRKLVESDEVLLIFSPNGTPTNSAIQKYLNAKKVPQLFAGSGGAKFNDPKNFPWTMGWQTSYPVEGQVYGKYLLKEKPDARIAVLFQNDDYGKDMLKGLRRALGERAAHMIVAEDSYEVSEPTIDSHVVKLRASGANVFVNFASPKFAAQAIKKVAELGWSPLSIVSNVSASVEGVLKPAGLAAAEGLVSATFVKDTSDPQWANDPGVKTYFDFLAKYMPGVNKADSDVSRAYARVQTLVEVLKNCGDNLTRENVMKQAANLKNFRTEMLLPGITVNTSPTNFAPLTQLQLIKFRENKWVLFGDVLAGDSDN
jgi:branched-chain amino acid transport system substrate-binding protein